MVDIELLASLLRSYGHTVTHIHGVPENAGEYEFTVDGNLLSLEEARALVAADEVSGRPRQES